MNGQTGHNAATLPARRAGSVAPQCSSLSSIRHVLRGTRRYWTVSISVVECEAPPELALTVTEYVDELDPPQLISPVIAANPTAASTQTESVRLMFRAARRNLYAKGSNKTPKSAGPRGEPGNLCRPDGRCGWNCAMAWES